MNKRLVLVELDDCDAESDELLEHVLDSLEANEDGYDYYVTEIAVSDVLKKMPQIVDEYLIFEFEDRGISFNFDNIFDLMEYVRDRPMVVCQTLLKLCGVTTKLHGQYYDLYNEAKEDFDSYTAERTAYLSSDECEIQFKKTGANIQAHVETDPTWKAKKAKLAEVEGLKSKAYTVKDLVRKAYENCDSFVKNADNVFIEDGNRDHTFSQVTESVIEDMVRADESLSE